MNTELFPWLHNETHRLPASLQVCHIPFCLESGYQRSSCSDGLHHPTDHQFMSEQSAVSTMVTVTTAAILIVALFLGYRVMKSKHTSPFTLHEKYLLCSLTHNVHVEADQTTLTISDHPMTAVPVYSGREKRRLSAADVMEAANAEAARDVGSLELLEVCART